MILAPAKNIKLSTLPHFPRVSGKMVLAQLNACPMKYLSSGIAQHLFHRDEVNFTGVALRPHRRWDSTGAQRI
jgi:hypothetical protein